jgi:regulator of replication initiation timing
MEIEELSQNIQRVISILHQKHDENEALKCELEKTRVENEALKCEIEHLLDALRRHEYESRIASAQYDDKQAERMGRILPHDDKSRSVTPTPTPPVRGNGGGGGKKTSL